MNYSLSEIELQNFRKWQKKHLRKHHNGKTPYSGAIGGKYSYIFTPTSIGRMVAVRCNHCKIEFDVTDMTDL